MIFLCFTLLFLKLIAWSEELVALLRSENIAKLTVSVAGVLHTRV